jgi:polyisoprenoid-binding protein YceI
MPYTRATLKKLVLATVLSAAAISAATAQDGTPPPIPAKPAGGPVKNASYVIDPTHTFVMYEMGHYGTTTNRGRFSTKDGMVQIDGTGASGKVDITMDISSINTGVDLLNRHVQSKDFFNVADFPTGRFVADRIDFSGDKVADVPGTLTLMGQTRPVTLKAVRFNCYLSPLINRQVCGGDFETTVERSDWGITWGLNFGFENKVKLLVQVEAVNVKQ